MGCNEKQILLNGQVARDLRTKVEKLLKVPVIEDNPLFINKLFRRMLGYSPVMRKGTIHECCIFLTKTVRKKLQT